MFQIRGNLFIIINPDHDQIKREKISGQILIDDFGISADLFKKNKIELKIIISKIQKPLHIRICQRNADEDAGIELKVMELLSD